MATPMTYLELVNAAIREARVTLDPLTVANFADPPRTRLYESFKDWVNDAYMELFLQPQEWAFKSARTNLPVYPAFYLENVDIVPAPGDILVGRNSKVNLLVTGVASHEEAPLTTPVEITVYADYLYPERNYTLLQVGEVVEVAGVPVATFGGQGTYNFKDLVPGMDEMFHTNIKMHSAPEPDDYYDGGYAASNRVRFIPWHETHNGYPTTSTWGAFISQNPQGNYQLFPSIQKKMLLSFDYSQFPVALVNASDVPTFLPAKYHPYLYWKAVMEYSDYDNKADVFRRAKKHLDRYEFTMYKEELPEPTIAGLY